MEHPRREPSGFTLIEVLIALGLGIIVISAGIGIFNYSQHSYNIQEDVAAMQQDLRTAKSFIERDVRMAGAGFTDYPRLSSIPQEKFLVVDFDNGGGEGASDTLTIRYAIPKPNACGTPPSGEVSCSALPALSLNQMPDDESEAPDPISIHSMELYVNEDFTATEPDYTLWTGACYCRGNRFNGTSEMPFLAAVTDPDGGQADLIMISGINSGSGGFSSAAVNDASANSYPVGSSIDFFDAGAIEEVQYYVQNGILMRRHDPDITASGDETTDPVAEHIEDLQFAFGLDTDDDNAVDYWADGSAGGDMDGAGDLTDANKALIRAVRISVLGRTERARKELEATVRPAVEDHAAGDAPDHFRRRLSQVTIEVRNLNLEAPEAAGEAAAE